MQPDKPAEEAPSDDHAHLPHDRDERAGAPEDNAQHEDNRESIRQAHDDVESGIEDTERIGTPSNVPASRDNEGA